MRLIKLRCVMLGHHDHIRRHRRRLYLECADCGRQTTGWLLSEDGVPSGRRETAVRVSRHPFLHGLWLRLRGSIM
jgi:hypothetical protein